MMLRSVTAVIFVAGLLSTGQAARAAPKAAGGTTPALQPEDTFHEDYPIDNSHMTPSQLRYKAQADYASAVARMKEEEGETVGAKAAAEAQLKKYHAAVAAAKKAQAARANAKAAAERAQQELDAMRAKLKAAGEDVSAAEAETGEAAAQLKAEQGALASANKQVEDMEAAEAAAKQALADKEAEVQAIRKQVATLEAEAAQAQGAIASAGDGVTTAEEAHKQQVLEHQAAQNVVSQSDAALQKELADEEAAKQGEAQAAAALKAAEAAVKDNSKTKKEWQAQIGTTKDAYAAAHAKYLKEQEDVVAARERVAIAKAQLSKHGVVIGSGAAGLKSTSSVVGVLLLTCLAALLRH